MQFVLPIYFWICGHPLECGWPAMGHTDKTECLSPRSHQLLRTLWLEVRLHPHLSSLCWDLVWLQLSKVLRILSQTLFICSPTLLNQENNVIHHLWLFFLQGTLSLGRTVCETDVSLRGEHPAAYFLPLGKLWFSVLIKTYWKIQFLW